jgi:hypothetical protein
LSQLVLLQVVLEEFDGVAYEHGLSEQLFVQSVRFELLVRGLEI